MKSISNRILVVTLALCALTVLASARVAQMHGQEKVQRPEGVGEELPGREAAEPPIIYGNQTPFGQLPETQFEPTEPSSVLDADTDESITQTVRKPSMQADEEALPGRQSDDPGVLELFPPAPTGGSIPQNVSSPLSNIAAPTTVVPNAVVPNVFIPNVTLPPSNPILPAPTPIVGSVPLASLDIPAGTVCPQCGSQTCTICCQPKCITKTILIPQYHTVWSSIFETRYRTEIKEEAYTVEQVVDHQVPRVIQETVMVPEPRIRTFQDFREEEYQVPVEEPYSVMVRKPRQRMVPVEREETYRYPEEQEYTVMVPEDKIVTETKYKNDCRQRDPTEEIHGRCDARKETFDRGLRRR